MDTLVKLLEEIATILDQIHTITTNQTTVLLQPKQTTEEENEAINVIEGMVEYKDEIIQSLNKKEIEFETAYEPYRGKITDKDEVMSIKKLVESIIQKKQTIVDAEKNNVMIMQNLGKKKAVVTYISPDASRVASAYKKQSK